MLRRAGTLREKAAQLGVSHEAVRQRAKARGVRTDRAAVNAERDGRIREIAVAGVPWPEIAAAVGLSPSGVRVVCRDLPARGPGGRPKQARAGRRTGSGL